MSPSFLLVLFLLMMVGLVVLLALAERWKRPTTDESTGPVKLAEVEASVLEPHTFELHYTAETDDSVMLMAKLRRHSPFGQKAIWARAPTVVRYRLLVDGEVRKEERVGIQVDEPGLVDRNAEQSFGYSAGGISGDWIITATHPIAEFRDIRAGSKLEVQGTLEPLGGVSLSMLEVFLTR